MPVLVDVEWVVSPQKERNLTQISAMRIDEFCVLKKEFYALVCPKDPDNTDWGAVAYNGHEPDDFLSAKSEEAVVKAFFDWLEPGDTLCCWATSAIGTMRQIHQRWMGTKLSIKCVALQEQIDPYLPELAKEARGLYAVAQACGVERLTPEHDSHNDVETLKELVQSLWKNQLKWMPEKKKAFETGRHNQRLRKEQNLKWMQQEHYAYLFVPGSKVFHRNHCTALLNARNIQGCIYYKKAAQNHRPCKLCHPIPDPDMEWKMAHQNASKIAHQESSQEDISRNEVIRTRLLGGAWTEIARKKLVGCCHNCLHPGKLTEKILEQHDCINKKCYYFERYPEADHWRKLEQKQKTKKEVRVLKRQKKDREIFLMELQERLQECAEQTNSPMRIVRVQEEKNKIYKVYYVSVYRYRDGNRFPDFLQMAKEMCQGFRLVLRHIQDVDGHFVTIEEYLHCKNI